ncbi:PAS domain-containing hybrid sensor histidine kinase/response regulator [Shewanella sp. 1_MG-2023]|uniref:histidine kinase n=1 Tax=Shewanella electrodiphila TaxID=934143 RepID=A0ABT0KN76_9GAMM|nr:MULTISPECIES: PAS domain-containing hybrid sensor histidine kinase/response regulator [Shewanella]MCL1045301.1 hybrid sensor histidine kinase/response regulator [Shewanella electrodiphila]MDO6611944.1 PAS domain-containing hybrid sensor histidine kinase/response regulator [Shewanella sp. 7_MG-2023]MDO6771799.1 PAS domain-containing hybrid sensor histidine kinase/response regulator [Shewanella sp. 2_MG-2023]MDO6794025.1 PAS domain-containing hybrid sensor histidine kinase/response regulator [
MNLTLVVAVIAICYVSLLFILAWGAERWFSKITKKVQVWIYGLSLAVYCSSWSFLGTVGQSANDLWSFLPIYLGPILVFTLGFGVLRKMVIISKAQNITSVADFIAARYGKSQTLAAIVTLIALFGIMPYIALQLKAMVFSLNLFQPDNQPLSPVSVPLLITFVLAIFAILFGTRKLDATEHNPGMMVAIAFESLVKLAAFLIVGFVITYGFFDGFGDIWQQASEKDIIKKGNLNIVSFLPEMLVGIAAFMCMPRQFHVMVVECAEETVLNKARWIFPLYLAMFGLFVAPLALAGTLLLGDNVAADTYVINLPLALDQPVLAVIALLGTLSAATGMVIVAVVTISVMISNEWLVPFMLRTGRVNGTNFNQFARFLLNARRLAIVIILALGYLSYLLFGNSESLSHLGQLSFGAFAQLAPALLGGMYWKYGNRSGVFLGLAVGFSLWCYILFEGSVGLGGDTGLLASISPEVADTLIALLANVICYVLGSLWFRAGVAERIQASHFINPGVNKQGDKKDANRKHGAISQQDLLILASRFVSPTRAYESFSKFSPDAVRSDSWHKVAGEPLISHTEHMLAGVLGASSASLVMDSVLQGRDLALDEVFSLVDEASSKIILSQDMLRGAIEHAYEGMSVVDKDLNLVAWNFKYAELYDYPEGFLQQGMPISEVVRFNAARGYCGEGDIETQVDIRVQHMRNGTEHTSERQRRDGKVIKIQGNPMPDGGFVMTFTDITQYRLQEKALIEANETLETRVQERTYELAMLNSELLEAKAQEELANASKSRFLAAVGHDLMQPLNAARLFTASLAQYPNLDLEGKTTISHINNSLRTAGELLTDLLDISKLDSGMVEVNRRDFALGELLNGLAVEFEAMAKDNQIRFNMMPCNATINSDLSLLRRILQNFLTNAYRYAKGGQVLLGCRRRGDFVEIQVLDTGCGIDENETEEIFKEFKRLNHPSSRNVSGLGLGLAIADRISKVLDHQIQVSSKLGQGSVFSIIVPLGETVSEKVIKPVPTLTQPLAGVKVLCIDNEEAILAGLESLLTRWKCEVVCASDLADARIKLGLKGVAPDIVLADYHLDNDQNGVDAMDGIRSRYGEHLPGILITANTNKDLVDDVQKRGYHYMAKMVKPAALRALISSLVK